MFEDNGWTVPTTLDELTRCPTRSPRRASSRGAPASAPVRPPAGRSPTGSRTSCCATAGPDVYDQWVNHEIPFNDPQVVAALDAVGDILKNDEVRQRRPRRRQEHRHHDVPGRRPADPRAASAPCTARRASTRQLRPEGTEVAEDGDVFAFYLPPIDERSGKPVLGGGEFVAAFADRPEVQAFQTYLVHRHLGQREGQGHPERRLGQRQQGPRRRQPGQPDRQAVRARSCRTRTRCSASTART